MENNFNPWEVFDEIECSHNPEYIVCVSHLRHYTNIFWHRQKAYRFSWNGKEYNLRY